MRGQQSETIRCLLSWNIDGGALPKYEKKKKTCKINGISFPFDYFIYYSIYLNNDQSDAIFGALD